MGTIWAEMGLRLDKLDAGVRLAQAKVQTAAELVESRASRMTTVFQRVGAGVSNLVSRVITLKNAMIAAVTTGVVGLGIRFDAMLEQAQIAFTTMLGSAQRAKLFLIDMQRFAAATPFEFPDLQNAARRMLALGFAANQILPDLRIVGDAVAAMGGGKEMIDRVVMALGQIKTKGTVQAEELLQLAEAGIPAYQILQEKLGLTADQVRNIGLQGLAADTVINALLQGLNERYAGAMDQQSKTAAGLFSTLKDNAMMLLGAVVEPLFNRIKQALPSITEAVTKVTAAFQDAGLRGAISNLFPPETAVTIIQALATIEQVGARLRGLMAALWPILQGVGGLLAAVFLNAAPPILAVVGYLSDFVAWLLKAQPLVYAIGGALAGWAIYQGVLQGIAAATKLWSAAQLILNAVMTANPVGLIIVGIGALIGLVYGLYKAWTTNWGGIHDKTDAVFAWLRGAFSSFVGFFKAWWPLLLAPLTGGLSLIGLLFTSKGRELLQSAMEWGSNIVKGLWNGLSSLTSWLIDKVSAWISSVIPGPIKKVLGIASPSKLMDEYGQNVGEGLAQGMDRTAPAVAASAKSLADVISERVEAATGRIDLALDVLQAKWDLQQKQMASNATQADALAAKQTMLQQQLALVQEKVAALNTAYEQMKAAKGAAAEETQKLYLELLKEQAAQIDLQRSIEDTTKAMQRQLQIKDGMAYVDQGGYSIGVPLGPARSWDENRNAAEVIAIANRQGVDLGTAASMYDANQDAVAQGKIPQYGRGGYVRRPTLALIGERGPEVVAPPAPLASTIGDAVYRAVRDALHVLRPDVPETGSQPVILSLDPLGLKRLGQALIPAMQAERIRRGEA